MINLVKGFTIFGLEVTFYGIIMAFSMLIGILVACKLAPKRNLKSDDIFTIALIILPCAILGARIFSVIGSAHHYTFWEFFKLWEGGMSIYGGIMGGAVGILLYCLIFKKNFLQVADVVCIALVLGQAIGRWGNYFNQEVYGQLVTDPSWQWFPFAVLLESGEWHYALFFYESIINWIIFAVLMIMIKKCNQRGYISATYLVSYGTIRFFLEPLRMPDYNLMLFGLKMSSIASVLAVIAGITIFVLVYTKQRWRKKHEKE